MNLTTYAGSGYFKEGKFFWRLSSKAGRVLIAGCVGCKSRAAALRQFWTLYTRMNECVIVQEARRGK